MLKAALSLLVLLLATTAHAIPARRPTTLPVRPPKAATVTLVEWYFEYVDNKSLWRVDVLSDGNWRRTLIWRE